MEYKLKDLVEIKYGKNQKNVKNSNGVYPILGTGGVMDYADDFLYDKPSVLIGRKGSIGKVKYIEKPFWTIDTLFYTVVKENLVLPKYLYYKLSQIDFNYYNEGTTIPSLRTETLYKISLDIPNIKTQKNVVKVLSNIDWKIELNQKIIANLQELSQTLFKRWFVDFEFPDENGNPYKSSGGVMVDSELGNIPELWSVIKTNDLFKIHSGYAFKSKWWDDSGYNVIKIKDINNKSIDINGLDKVKENYVKKASKFKVYGGEIIIALTGATAGKMGVVPKLKQTAFVNQRVGLITSNIDNVYIYHLLNSERIKRLTLEQAVGSAQANISPVKFGNIKIISADKKIIDRYCQLTKNNYEKIVELHSENNYLTQLRDTLLPKLMSGEIEIPDDIEVMEDELSI
ncbi:restriction endonuclease subunit S [Staphylococcus pseudintermedius]|uniref:restriction endonuclease subunit S n=1 Tax=Staphylococcus pseudintermedius TaxID=283734 RepID=UPI0018F641CD|nr:restriction endonuclease subunit S [Staphylococcus pseudintermedius]EGQ1697996.1 restriction endonuclease subunit S [Staphylococcus pseudintermedius]EGQ3345131.1 restriction endonuclease subunit S [Staphylococcus pseudintermedius]EGQ3842064.1 restriction endonuclease subunit S [Staphylococcus pseudintermedius]EGQ4271382.1 restriction endonuclease subunit S [Staphylococcus pseudintermedius]EGQ4444861.1 restriction endonuclease subunit S [Staphylococcus pseudintermedius]